MKVASRRWPLLLISVAVALAGTVVLTSRQAERFSATSSVLLLQTTVGAAVDGLSGSVVTDPAALTRLAQNQATVADNPRLAERVKRTSGYPGSVTQLRSETGIEPSDDADIINFSVETSSAEGAAVTSRAWAEQYLVYQRDLQIAPIETARRQIRGQLNRLNKTGGGDAAADSLRLKDQQLETLEVLQTPSASIAELATGASRSQPRIERNLGLAVVLGALLGVVLMFAREALEDRTEDPTEIGSLLGATFLGFAPIGRRRHGGVRHTAATVERYDVLRAELSLVLPNGQGPRTITMTGGTGKAAQAEVVANLALAFRRSGKAVKVVDMDGRSERVAMRLEDEHLLSLYGEAQADASAESSTGAIEDRPVVARVREAPPNLGDERLRQLLTDSARHADLLLVRAGSVTHSGAAVTALHTSDLVLVVASTGRTTRSELLGQRRVLELAPERPVAFVLTDDGA